MEIGYDVGRHYAARAASDRGRGAPCHRCGRLWSWSGTGQKARSSIPHRGVDFNYIGGKHARLNRSNPELRSPVAGIVTNAGEGSVGRIAIRDANGFSHEILHTQTQKVRRGDLVGVGQPIGTMGNTGTYDQHVHYQLKDPAGHAINPTEFWDRLGQAKSDPGELAYRDQYQQYLLGRDVDAANEFGGAVPSVTPTSRTNSPAGNGVTNSLAPFESLRTGASRPVPYLDSTNAAQQLFAKVPPTDFPAFPS